MLHNCTPFSLYKLGLFSQVDKKIVRTEIGVLLRLSHPNIVSLKRLMSHSTYAIPCFTVGYGVWMLSAFDKASSSYANVLSDIKVNPTVDYQ